MFFQLSITTPKEDFYNITQDIQGLVDTYHFENGLLTVFCPHTTAGITINEGVDHDGVTHDLLLTLNQCFPKRPEYVHWGGNSDAHLKAALFGSSVNVIVNQGKLQLGTWQGIYFCEFDPPRNRQYYVHFISC